MTYDVNALLKELHELRLPELQARYEKELGTRSRCPNRTFLIRSICSAVAERAKGAADNGSGKASSEELLPTNISDAAVAPAEPEVVLGRRRERGRFTSMTVEELQNRYREVVGRDTGSDNKRYLIWKIREVEKGNVPTGPRSRVERTSRGDSMRVLPLRLEAEAISAIDRAWRAAGLKSRMAFFREALRHELGRLGGDGASLFEAPAHRSAQEQENVKQ